MNAAAPDEAGATLDRGGPVYWTIRDVEHHCQVSRATAWRLARGEGFPSPIVLGPRIVRWRRDEVIAFIEGRRDEEHYAASAPTTGTAPFAVRTVRSG